MQRRGVYTYTATLKGGASGVKDLAGNPLTADKTWSFSTAFELPPPPDITAPETTIDSGPSGTLSSGSASFAFSSSEANSAFECSLDGGAFVLCSSPKSYVNPLDGSHTFRVRATDAVGNTDATPASRTWTVDATAPTVTTVAPQDGATDVAATSNAEATFSEAIDSSSITDQSFTLTKQGFSSPVAARVTYDAANNKAILDPDSNLEAKTTYTARVKGGSNGAKDPAGNALAQDHGWTFTTVTTAPDTTIVSGPSGNMRSTSATFSFSSSKPGSTFQCSRDGSAFAACTSPKSYSSLSQGNHAFRVRAIDTAGNIDVTPATRSWFVDTVIPRGTISINGGAYSTVSRYVTLRLSASDLSLASGVAYMRFRNSGTITWSSWVAYATSKSWTLTTGADTKTVYVQYRDRAGNRSAAASDTITFRP